MSTFQDVLDQIATVIGGTAFTANGAPKFFSGYNQNAGAGDGTGIAGLHGCYSAPPEALDDVPVGVLLLDSGSNTLGEQGFEENEDRVILHLCFARNIPEAQMPNLAPFRDTVPAALRAHMQLNGTPNVLDAFPVSYKAGVITYGGSAYLGISFTIRVRRILNVTYVI